MYEQMLGFRQLVRERSLVEPGLDDLSASDNPNLDHEIWQKLTSRRPWLKASIPEPNASSGQSVLSTLTTTERHVGADGTIMEKTILKKRFADGREEIESTTTTRDGNPTMAWARQRQLESEAPMQAEHESKIANEAKRSRGWFWSS
jgi:hypothetical protein